MSETDPDGERTDPDGERIVPERYPQLHRIAWNRRPDEPMDGPTALSIYEREWRHVDAAAMTDGELRLLSRLIKTHGRGAFLPTGDTHGLRLP